MSVAMHFKRKNRKYENNEAVSLGLNFGSAMIFMDYGSDDLLEVECVMNFGFTNDESIALSRE